jgi:hypothetical protein
VGWAEIEPLFIWSVRSSKLVAYQYLPGRKPANLGALSRLNSGMGLDGSLPPTLAMPPEALAQLMNTRRQAAVGG